MLNHYNKTSLIGALLFAAILLFFRIPVSNLLDWAIVNPLFATFESSIGKDIFLFILLFSLILFIELEAQWKVVLRFFLYGLVFYGFQRANNYWTFIYTSLIEGLTYWDIVFIAGAFCLIFTLLWNCKKNNTVVQEQHDGFIEDNAVTSPEEDHFKRTIVAAEIARLILLTNNRKSMAIGILGEYGSGKTSFLNLINVELENEQVLKIAFNPWSAGNPDSIRREFFDLLAREVAGLDRKISSAIYSYGRKLSSFDARSLSLLNWFGFLNNQGVVQSSDEYKHINKMLAAAERKVIVTIDDLDRLHPAEIIEVLKLIRNTADFSNMVYLVGYDKAYVQDALRTLNETSGRNYLDKIFQLEIPLPKRDENDLLNLFQEHLKNILSPNHYEQFDKVMIPNDFRDRFEKSYEGILRQGRDVVRFVNSFKVIYKLIGEEVDFESLMLLELIKFRFPAIYELIYTQSDLFLVENPLLATHAQYYSPRMTKIRADEKKSDEVSIFKTHIEKFEGLTTEEVSLVDGLFMKLFDDGSYNHSKPKNSICYPLYFEIYFRYRLTQKDLSDKEFRNYIANGKMQNYMQYCASHNLHKELMIRLMQEDITKNKLHFEKMIRWVFSFGRTFVEKEDMFRFDYTALIDKISNYHNMITDQLYKKDPVAYARFIDTLFANAIPPFLFESNLIYHLKKKGDYFVIPAYQLTLHQLSYFTRMAETNHGLSELVLWLFWIARTNSRTSVDSQGAYEDRWSFEPDLVVEMKGYLAYKDPKYFLKFSIVHNMHDSSHASISSQVIEMFNDPTEYRQLIVNHSVLDEGIKNEYLDFFDRLAENNFKEPVTVEFKTELKKVKEPVDAAGIE